MTAGGDRVWAEIDLDAIRKNVGLVKAIVGPGVEVLVVAKANAYGHGAVPVVRAVLSAGASAVGVGDSGEALELIDAGLRAPILILGTIVPVEAQRVVEAGVEVALHSDLGARLVAAAASRVGKVARVHLMVDTGMGRLGAQPAEVPKLLEEILATGHLSLVGLATHLSTPSDDAFSAGQLDRFDEARRVVERRCLPGRLRIHAAASAALIRYPKARYNAVRPGLFVYGLDPGGGEADGRGFVPALALRTQIAHLKDVPEGSPIGYERTWVTPRATKIATLPVGYNDGFPLALSSTGEVLVRGRRVRVVGRVSMDYTMIDVGEVPGVSLGDVVTLIGRDGSEEIRVEEVARKAGTIPYAILCGLGNRVRRRYKPAPETLPLSETPLDSSRR